jgi:hypothetical protein
MRKKSLSKNSHKSLPAPGEGMKGERHLTGGLFHDLLVVFNNDKALGYFSFQRI